MAAIRCIGVCIARSQNVKMVCMNGGIGSPFSINAEYLIVYFTSSCHLSLTVKYALPAALILLFAFEIVLLSLILRGIEGDCGCFGKFGGTPRWAFVKNILIILLTSYSIFLGAKLKKEVNPQDALE